MKEDEYKKTIDQIIEYRFTKPDLVLEMAIKMYQKSSRKKDYHIASIAKFYEGDAYLTLDELDKACEPLLESINLQETYGFVDYLGKAYNVLGGVFYCLGDYILAMKYLMKALEVSIDSKDLQTEGFISNNIAAVFLIYSDYKNAHVFYKRALKSMEKFEQDQTDIRDATNRMKLNRAICYNSEEKYQEAKKEMDDIFASFTTEEIENLNMFVWELAVSLCENLGETDRAIGYAKRMVESARTYCTGENINVISDSVRILAENGYEDMARELLEIATTVSKKSESTMNEFYILNDWINFYKIIGDEQSCNKYYRRYYELVQNSRIVERKNQQYAMENRGILQAMEDEKISLQKKNKQIKKITTSDALTGLFNRTGMMNFVNELFAKNIMSRENVNLAIIDIDYFKECNDTHGHMVGDRCLVEVADILRKIETDRIKACRFGGDEFFVIGDGYSTEEWQSLCKMLHSDFGRMKLEDENGNIFSLTVSIGAFSKAPNVREEFNNYIHNADIALYKVKQAGRDGFLAQVEE